MRFLYGRYGYGMKSTGLEESLDFVVLVYQKPIFETTDLLYG